MNYSQAIQSLRFKRIDTPAINHRAGVSHIVGGWAFWRGVATPGYIRDQVNALFADTVSLDTTIIKEVESRGDIGKASSPFWIFSQGTMLPFKMAVTKFTEEHQGWTSNLWGSVLDTVNEFRDRLREIHGAAVALGFTLSGAPAPKGRTDFGDPTLGNLANRGVGAGTEVFGVIKTILYIAMLGALGMGLVYMVRH